MPRFPRHPFAEQRSKELRRNLTEAEALLWHHIRHDIPAKFRRQEPIGGYICDFVCYSRRLIVELDGSQHADSAHDVRRDDWLRSQGFTILRFWNDEVFRECDEVLDTIYNAVVEPDSPPSPDSSPSGGGGSGEAADGGGQTVPRPTTG